MRGSGASPCGTRGNAAPVLSVVVVTFRRRKLVEECLESVEAALDRLSERAELIVVDNGSADGTGAFLGSRFSWARVVEIPANVGFTPAAMEGMRRTRGEWIALLNDDTVVEPAFFVALLAAGRRSTDTGSVAAQMRFADRPDLINSAGLEIDRLGVASDRLLGAAVDASETAEVEVFGASGGAALYRRRMLQEIDWFDESFFAYLEDADVAWRARMRGWRAIYAPAAIVYHHHSATLVHGSPQKYFLVGRNRVRLLAKNADRRHLWRYGVLMLGYDLAYVVFACLKARTLAPAGGRLRGLREWRRYRRVGNAYRRPVSLARPSGLRGALRRYHVWTGRMRAWEKLAR